MGWRCRIVRDAANCRISDLSQRGVSSHKAMRQSRTDPGAGTLSHAALQILRGLGLTLSSTFLIAERAQAFLILVLVNLAFGEPFIENLSRRRRMRTSCFVPIC
jgi:hypothetical protein